MKMCEYVVRLLSWIHTTSMYVCSSHDSETVDGTSGLNSTALIPFACSFFRAPVSSRTTMASEAGSGRLLDESRMMKETLAL